MNTYDDHDRRMKPLAPNVTHRPAPRSCVAPSTHFMMVITARSPRVAHRAGASEAMRQWVPPSKHATTLVIDGHASKQARMVLLSPSFCRSRHECRGLRLIGVDTHLLRSFLCTAARRLLARALTLLHARRVQCARLCTMVTRGTPCWFSCIPKATHFEAALADTRRRLYNS